MLAGHRYYQPATRRWLNRDPIGYEGGINLYAYCGNDPVNEIDPDGNLGGAMEGALAAGHIASVAWQRFVKWANTPFYIGGEGSGDLTPAQEQQAKKTLALSMGLITAANMPVDSSSEDAPETESGTETATVAGVEPAAAAPAAATAQSGRLVIGKVSELSSVREGEYTLLSRMTSSLGSPKINWDRNFSLLRGEMKLGRPIRDAHVDHDGQLAKEKYNSFLNSERYTLQTAGWHYSPKTTLWMPPAR